jgi:hypothetical protein
LRTHDQSQVTKVHPELTAGDLLVADRGFCSYVHLALLLRQNLHAVFRMHQCQSVSFRKDRRLSGKQPRGTATGYANSRLIRKLGRFDQIVEYTKSRVRPKWMDKATFAAVPITIQVREVRYQTSVRGFRTKQVTLVTTLLDAER